MSVLIFMLGCTFFVIFEGAKALQSVSPSNIRILEVEKIFNSRVFEKEEVVREKLDKYFRGLEQKIKTANLCFAFAYVMTSLMLHMIAPGSSVWASFAAIFAFYLGPLAIGFSAAYEVGFLKREMADRFNAR